MAQILISSFIFCLISSLTTAWDFNHDFDFLRKHHIVRRDTNFNYTKILNFWEENKAKLIFQDIHEGVVLILGNTGAGKSTLVSALTGQKLKSIKREGEAYRVFADVEDRVGTGLTSKTLVPEAITDNKRNITYVDCSGFRDNRDAEYEISSIYFQNIFMNQVEKIKIVLVINYDSLKSSGNKNDFDDLFEHVGEFIKNISKYHDGIALVATKVENIYDWSDDEVKTPVLLNDDQSVRHGIADYLKRKQEIYRSKSEHSEKYKIFADLIDYLVQKKNSSYSRIAIFRQPTRSGELDKLPKTKEEIDAIANMITENLHFIVKNKTDFGIALSKSSKMLIDQIVDDIFRNALMSRLYKMGNETHTHFLQIEKQYNDIDILGNQFLQAYQLISKVKNVKGPLEFFKEFLDATNTLNISVSQTNLNDISDDVKKLQFFTTVSNSNGDIHMMLLQNGLQNILDLIKSFKNIYDFLNNLQDNLATYQSQKLKNDSRINRIKLSCLSLKPKAVQNITELGNIVKEIGSDEIYQKIKTLNLNRLQLHRIEAIFNVFTSKFTSTCTSEQLIAKGYNLKLSDVVKIDCWAQAKNIQIFALNKVFIDCTVDKAGAEAQIFIIAPTWEVVGEPKIILNGKAGESRGNTYSKVSRYQENRGQDGSQGLPGGPGGHFFGVGKRFINSDNLEIHSNGGTGGPGQMGQHGMDGVEGLKLPRSFFTVQRSKWECKLYFHRFGFYAKMWPEKDLNWNEGISFVTVRGRYPEVMPGDGGNGGEGGHGGYPGTIVINGLGESVDVRVFTIRGYDGLQGRGGRGGKETLIGETVSFDVERSFPFFGSFKYTHIRYNYPVSLEDRLIPAGRDGMIGVSTKDEVFPTKLSMVNPYFAINTFKSYVRENLIHNLRESNLKSFIEDLHNSNYIKAEYNTLIFVKEFEELEKQYLKLRNKIDFTSFYNSLLTRIEKFADSEKSLENKKVLSYVYTAALTKAFVLKKKRKGKTVVNLYKYLDTIESNINELQKTMHLQTVQDYRNEYNYTLTKKIQEAKYFIKNKIEPEIDHLWKQSNNQIKAFIREIQETKKVSRNNIAKLEKERQGAYDVMQFHLILKPLKIAVACLSFIGTFGTTVGTVVTNILSVPKGMRIDNNSGEEKNGILPTELLSELPSRITEVFGNKPRQLIDTLVKVFNQLKKYKNGSFMKNRTHAFDFMFPMTYMKNFQEIYNLGIETYRIKNIVSQTIEEAANLQESAMMIKEKLLNFVTSQIDVLEEEKKQLNETEPEQKNEQQVNKDLNLMKRAQSLLTNVYSVSEELKSDEEQIKNIDDLIEEHGQHLKSLERLEDRVYKTVIPDLRQIERAMTSLQTSSLNGSSHVKLDVTKWTVSSTLKDVKSLLQKLTYKMSFELRNNLERFMEKIDEGFSILIDIYDRIDAYADSVKQAEYIAYIESATMNNIQVTDFELSEAMINLQLIIHSNILTEKYEIALHAFKQHYFPFAAHVLKRFQLPAGLELNETDTLRRNIIDRIRDMKNHIDESEATIDEYSKFVHENSVFNNNTTGSSPFYVWRHEIIKDEIQQLINGSEIVIKADISKGLYYNSVKYSEVGINFKLRNETLQNNFTSILQNFALTMTMVGNNYYRCGERYYYISFDDDITISYTLEQDESKNWIDSNMVYTKIRRSHPFLSPYGMWNVKLKNIDKSVSWDQLRVFANETIDLELVGHGYYIEQDRGFNFEVCNEYLDAFYNVENIVKELE